MRVLLLTGHYTAGPGGAETVTVMTESLLQQAGHEVIPFAPREPDTIPTPWQRFFPPPAGAGARTEPGARFAAIYSRPARRSLEALIRYARPDVAHVHHIFELLTLSVLDVLSAYRIPVVMTLHDYRPVCPNYRLFTAGRPCRRCLHHGRVWNVVRHHCLRGEGSRWRAVAAGAEAGLAGLRHWWSRIGLFIAPSAFLRDQVVAGGLPAARVVVVPNPVRATDRLTRYCGGVPTFLYAGRLVAEKGLDVLLEAARLLPAGVKVVLLGTGRLEGAVRARVTAERLPVEVRGFATRTVVDRQLAGATAALLPALWYENCPMAVLEAAAQGVPAVASAIGGIPELVTDGVTGLLVPPGDAAALAVAMQTLAADPGRAVQLGAAAWHRAHTHHDPADHLAALLDCYARVIR
ncbi:MAG: glycosyltransferase [Actinomycetota bacterium]|nr:glycosyltransferase [Actinomycetota bacterium]